MRRGRAARPDDHQACSERRAHTAGLEAGRCLPGFLPKRHVRGRRMMGEGSFSCTRWQGRGEYLGDSLGYNGGRVTEDLGQLVCGEGATKTG